jgi:hypothetical protein
MERDTADAYGDSRLVGDEGEAVGEAEPDGGNVETDRLEGAAGSPARRTVRFKKAMVADGKVCCVGLLTGDLEAVERASSGGMVVSRDGDAADRWELLACGGTGCGSVFVSWTPLR